MMRKTIATLAILIGAVFAALPVAAQETPNAKIIVIDFARVSRESLAGLDIANQLKSNNVKLQNRATELQDQLRKEQENLAAELAGILPKRCTGFST